jgi:hypothetical protein
MVEVVAVDLLDDRSGEAKEGGGREKLGPLGGVETSVLDRALKDLEIGGGIAAVDVLVADEGS